MMNSNKKSNKKQRNTAHDALIKRVMSNPIVAKEFLEEYLPTEFKDQLVLEETVDLIVS